MNKALEILLIEDNPDDAELAMRALKKHMRNEIKWIGDGEKAMEFLFSDNQDEKQTTSNNLKLILLDLKLPKVNGREILKALKSDPIHKNIPVVVMTSSNQPSDLQECYDLGANSYVVKPINFEQFTRAVREISLYWLLVNQPPET